MFLFRAYISSSRPATLLLAMACALLGSALALFAGFFNVAVFVLTLLTALSLQVISNLANDYGDYQKGADKVGHRVGPVRALQKGEITAQHLKKMILFSIFLSIALGATLLYFALSSQDMMYVFAFLLLGILSIWAAIKYTAGKNPYGYRGLGDLFTFIFFGPVGVVGAYFLQTHQIDFTAWLPSIGFGVLTIMVINVNNMRDAHNDKLVGKVTIPVILGEQGAKCYHATLTLTAFLCFLSFAFIYLQHGYQYLYMLIFLPLFKCAADIYKIETGAGYAPYLKKTVLLSFVLTMVFSICINLG
ncbi:MAG: 1,4-dihydroxy-2-naphthoate octaprenyltransferase [Saezia sp.]